jgi:P27 family predicted phage terminase small subunit
MHLVAGTFREDRHGSRTAAEDAKRATKAEPIPSAPKDLTPPAQQEWRRVAAVLHKRGLLGSLDRAALAGYCQAYGEVIDSERGIAAELAAAVRLAADETAQPAERSIARRIVAYRARVVPGTNGGWVRNPAVLNGAAAAKRVREFCIEFGMTPSSSHRMQFSRGPAGGGVEEFRGKHPKAQQGRAS